MSDLALSVRNLSKSYTIAHNAVEKESTLTETLLKRLKRPLSRTTKETFWALKDINFDVKKGEVVGIIGRNGAGKSTLLKILSRITEPTTGEINLYGRVGSLLEVGTGFHPELTGRENIFLNGAILGMNKAEIKKQFDAIVDFSSVEKFLDTPVKRYSSGMYVRLAFAVAAHLRSEILIVDEVLAVGDAEFQKKCLGKMQSVSKSGKTILFVSHQMHSVMALCNKCIFLHCGSVRFSGSVPETVGVYLEQTEFKGDLTRDIRHVANKKIAISRFATTKAVYNSTEVIEFDFDVSANLKYPEPYFVSIHIINSLGSTIFHLDSRLLNKEFDASTSRTIQYAIKNPRLSSGNYRIDVFLCNTSEVLDSFDSAACFSIAELLPYPSIRGDISGFAIVYPDFEIREYPCKTGK
jgi:lipopolysaccharide transport system ATP-binding protein